MTGGSAETLDLQAAADELGVHYQTAYRWVRSGRLPASVEGGRYAIDRADLEAYRAARSEPVRPAPPSVRRRERAAERMYGHLVAGEEAAATQIARRLVSDGTPVVDLVQDVLVPPLRRIGDEWHAGDLTIWVEHRASAIVERILGALAPNPRGRRRGTAVVAAVAGDRHSLPTTMAAIALRADNWHVHHLGADMPPDEVVRFCREHDVAIGVLTVTNTGVVEHANRTAERLRAGGTPTVVGGPGLDLWSLIERARAVVASGSSA